MKSSIKKSKYFFISMISTLLFLCLFSGLVVAEKNTRYIAFGDSSPLLTFNHDDNKHFSLSIYFMGTNYKLSI